MLRPISLPQNLWLGSIAILLLVANVQGSNIYTSLAEQSARAQKQPAAIKALEDRVTALETQRKADHDQFEREHAVFLAKSKAMDAVCDRLSEFMKVKHAR